MLVLILSSIAFAADWPTGSDPAAWSTTAAGIAVQDLVLGTGAEVVDRAGVEVHYIGMLADGTVFDASRERGQTLSFRVGAHEVIHGWEEGLLGMRIGGTRRLVIPASEGYGDKAMKLPFRQPFRR